MRIISLLLLHFAFASSAFAQVFQIDLKEDTPAILNERSYAFFSHSTSYWDTTKKAYQGSRNLFDYARRKQIPILVSVHSPATSDESTANQYYVSNAEADLVLQSEAGQHMLSFPNAGDIYFSGGNLTMCLCEAIRDVARGTQANRQVNLHVVTDAVYDFYIDVKSEQKALDYVKKYIVPNFICPDQNSKNYPGLALGDALLEVYYGEKSLGKFDLFPSDANPIEKLNRRINLRFVGSQTLQ